MSTRNNSITRQRSRAGRLGGIARMLKHGNPGTQAGRSKGGMRSLDTHAKQRSGFKMLKKIRRPSLSRDMAEFIGILAGDGHVDTYQVTISTNRITDLEYASFVKDLVQRLFKDTPTLRERKDHGVTIVVISSKIIADICVSLGIPRGNKLKGSLTIPDWIKRNRTFAMAFLRGLHDTDGSIFLDEKTVNRTKYAYLGWGFTSASESFRGEVCELLRALDFTPRSTKNNRSIYIRKKDEIIRYFAMIGTHNQKHQRRFDDFVVRTGRVPKRS